MNNKGFLKFDVDVLRFKFGSIEEMFYIYLMRQENRHRLEEGHILGEVKLTRRTIAKDLDITEGKARGLINKFIELGIIELVRPGGKGKIPSVYKLTVYNQQLTQKNVGITTDTGEPLTTKEPINNKVVDNSAVELFGIKNEGKNEGEKPKINPHINPHSNPQDTRKNGLKATVLEVNSPAHLPLKNPQDNPPIIYNIINNKKDICNIIVYSEQLEIILETANINAESIQYKYKQQQIKETFKDLDLLRECISKCNSYKAAYDISYLIAAYNNAISDKGQTNYIVTEEAHRGNDGRTVPGAKQIKVEPKKDMNIRLGINSHAARYTESELEAKLLGVQARKNN